MSAKIDVEIRRILEEQFDRAESIISSNKDRLDAVAEMLIKYERVSGEQFEAVYRGADMDEVMGKKKVETQEPSSEEEQSKEQETAEE